MYILRVWLKLMVHIRTIRRRK